MRDTDLVNPDWERPPDWKFEADWDSPAWKRQMAESDARTMALRQKYGFDKCPDCGVVHTSKTLFCRGCGHKAEIPDPPAT